MRIAICISGFLRIWKHTKRSFIEMLLYDSTIEVDLFIHTYHQNLYESTSGLKDEYLTVAEIQKLFEGLTVRKLVVEDRSITLKAVLEESADIAKMASNYNLQQPESGDPSTLKTPIGARIYDHLRKIHLCNLLRQEYERETGTVYDLVVKTRFDLLYLSHPSWRLFLDNRFHFGYGATWGWPEDTFCVTTPLLMDAIYACRFLYLREMILNGADSICAHGSLKYMIRKHKIKVGYPAVNILCFRNTKSVQYGGNYRFKYSLERLYTQMKSKGPLYDPIQTENIKRLILNYRKFECIYTACNKLKTLFCGSVSQ
jgi:hypothetical protein